MANRIFSNRIMAGALGIALFAPVTLLAQTFESNLSKLAKLYDSKKYEELYNAVKPTKALDNLKDVRLYLEAEALKNTARKAEAYKVYSDILNNYPDSEVAVLSAMPHFMLGLEAIQPNDLPKLEAEATTLKTVWSRGTAFSKLADLAFLDPVTRSRLAFKSIMEFNSERFFYQTAPASVDTLQKIIKDPAAYRFSRQEWLTLAVCIINENLTSSIFGKGNDAQKIAFEANAGKTVADILYAEYLNKQKKSVEASNAFQSVINNKANAPELIAWAYQLRGNMNHFANKHSDAVSDYVEAMKGKSFPVDQVAIRYRLMRSYFECGRDTECIELMKQFIQGDFKGAVLPVHIYEMALKCYDAQQFQRAVPYFMILAKNFPGHHRADDALGYAALCVGTKTKEGKSLIDLLIKKYPNSFFIWWLSPESRKNSLKLSNKAVDKLSPVTLKRLDAMDKLWATPLNFLAKSEAVKMTDKYKANLSLYKAIIDLCSKHNDYNQLVSYGERLSRQISEADKPLTDMPKWGWQALYPLAYEAQVKKNATKFGIDYKWVLSIMREESHFKEDILSRSNAMSLMQILPSTGKWIAGKLGEKGFKKDMLWKPEVNLRYGSWYLKYLSDLFNGDMFLASASYNGGQGNIQRKVEAGPYAKKPVLDRLDKVPMQETRDYYKKVMGTHWVYTRLY